MACTPLNSAVADIRPISRVASCMRWRIQWLSRTRNVQSVRAIM
jgi:hypothetical protein